MFSPPMRSAGRMTASLRVTVQGAGSLPGSLLCLFTALLSKEIVSSLFLLFSEKQEFKDVFISNEVAQIKRFFSYSLLVFSKGKRKKNIFEGS